MKQEALDDVVQETRMRHLRWTRAVSSSTNKAPPLCGFELSHLSLATEDDWSDWSDGSAWSEELTNLVLSSGLESISSNYWPDALFFRSLNVTRFTSLDLCISKEAVSALAEGLLSLPSLKTCALTFVRNIPPESFGPVIDALSNLKFKLSSLSWSDGGFSVSHLADLLRRTNLTSLRVSNSSFSLRNFGDFCSALPECPSLLRFGMTVCKVEGSYDPLWAVLPQCSFFCLAIDLPDAVSFPYAGLLKALPQSRICDLRLSGGFQDKDLLSLSNDYVKYLSKLDSLSLHSPALKVVEDEEKKKCTEASVSFLSALCRLPLRRFSFFSNTDLWNRSEDKVIIKKRFAEVAEGSNLAWLSPRDANFS
jgi:hypothetical protein